MSKKLSTSEEIKQLKQNACVKSVSEKVITYTKEFREEGLIKPEAEWQGDGTVLLTFMIPESSRVAEFAALEMGKKMGVKYLCISSKQETEKYLSDKWGQNMCTRFNQSSHVQ